MLFITLLLPLTMTIIIVTLTAKQLREDNVEKKLTTLSWTKYTRNGMKKDVWK